MIFASKYFLCAFQTDRFLIIAKYLNVLFRLPWSILIKHKTADPPKMVNIFILNVSTLQVIHLQKNDILNVSTLHLSYPQKNEIFTIFGVSIVLCFINVLSIR